VFVSDKRQEKLSTKKCENCMYTHTWPTKSLDFPARISHFISRGAFGVYTFLMFADKGHARWPYNTRGDNGGGRNINFSATQAARPSNIIKCYHCMMMQTRDKRRGDHHSRFFVSFQAP